MTKMKITKNPKVDFGIVFLACRYALVKKLLNMAIAVSEH
jgi:hypothetical protein